MHTVSETHSFRRVAGHAGMSEDEVRQLVNYLAENPTAGNEIVGSGGCRKVRWAGKGKGKSGGYRVITFYSGIDTPVFLITMFSKGERANLTQKEVNQLAVITKAIADEYRRRVVKVSSQ